MLLRAVIFCLAAAFFSPAVSLADDSPPPPKSAVEKCIADNGGRYSTPDKAWITQYISLEDACRAKFAKEGDVSVTVTPLGGSNGASAAESRAAVDAEVGGTVDQGATPARTRTRAPGATARAGGSGGSGGPAPTKKATGRLVRAALATTAPAGGRGFGPSWLLVVLVTPAALAAAFRAVRRF